MREGIEKAGCGSGQHVGGASVRHNDNPCPAEDDEVSNDAIQLIVIATFNGLCRTMTALAEQGLLSEADIDGIHDAMTTPLDDPKMRDDDVVADTRALLEKILAAAMRLARCGLVRDD